MRARPARAQPGKPGPPDASPTAASMRTRPRASTKRSAKLPDTMHGALSFTRYTDPTIAPIAPWKTPASARNARGSQRGTPSGIGGTVGGAYDAKTGGALVHGIGAADVDLTDGVAVRAAAALPTWSPHPASAANANRSTIRISSASSRRRHARD